MERPELYVQHLEDEAAEEQDDFDQLHPVIGGEPGDRYRVGVAIDDGYLTETADDLAEADDILNQLLADADVSYDRPDDIEDIMIDERAWRDE